MEENVQYYYDSSADKWWYFDTAKQGWSPWEETPENAEGEATSSGGAVQTSSPTEDTQTESISHSGEAPTESADNSSSSDRGQGEEGVTHTPTEKIAKGNSPSSQATDKLKAACTSVRSESCSSRVAEHEGGAKRADAEGDGQNVVESNSGDKDESAATVASLVSAEKEAENDTQRTYSLARSDASDRVRDMLARLASTTSLDRALTNIAVAGSTSHHDFFMARRKTGAGVNPASGRDGVDASNADDDRDSEDEEIPEIVHDPIVRRSTRMLTFKDKGGLAGCLKAVAAQRKSLIEEAGGLVPGTEDYRQEEIKRRARQLASQSHVRAQRRWLDAARMASGAAPKPAEKIKRFSDLVDRLREKPAHEDEDEPVLAGLAAPSHALTAGSPPGALGAVDDSLASKLLMKPEIDLREQRRRSSGFTGGQEGYVRFADATFRDPNFQLQMKDLLTQQGRRKGSIDSTDSADYTAGSAAAAERADASRE
ncbi:conserved hypothetical protein [Neospora caninum Liverpool]|uniref:Uncharacterized protein n=1 Tax=Neospora caninum (strain Liverpool) TaxID=572307 RepID=F0VRB6_NEOCL|nr:conserved hypothetical protein [Neospora caninum Liverpool]CBZ56264.1 conserved hypothetical protein [Neospora caninum Liverpool]CEL71026.1 TPA: hypothetical protein BN1204_066890 [Neospora caninum Liverpool]|eukprot:XP_003886289.1 conserved hypothetical protein [Neospora caninum Liverpool]